MIEKINSVLDVLRNASLFNPAMGQVVIYSLGGLEDFSYGGFLIDFLGEEGISRR